MYDLLVAAAAVGVWLIAYGLCRLLTRPASPPAGPATMDLGPEPPALVNLLVSRWAPNEDAAEATVLDLAARRFIELRQPAADPMQTTIHKPQKPPDETPLRPYERQVLDRIRGLAVNGVVPVTALTFREAGESKKWNQRLRQAVAAEARAAGLSRRRISKTISGLLTVIGAGAAVVVWLAMLHLGQGKIEDDKPPALVIGIFTFAALASISAASLGERETPAGRAAASRWLGVRDWLRGHEQFADLPPASVAIWDRYLAYGAALGVTRVASAVLDLEMGDKKLVWSSYGGTWHRVRVRYPSFWPRYGRTLTHLLLRAGAYLLVGGLVLRFLSPIEYASLAGALLMLLGAYVLVRSLLDLALTREITGEVLWRETWKTTRQDDDNPAVPWLDHLAIDDGSADRTTAWGLPSETGAGCADGDTVTITVRPWSRRIVRLVAVGHGRSRALDPVVTEEETGDLSLSLLPAAAAAPGLFAVDEVAQVVGRPVEAAPMPLGLQYVADGRVVLLVQAVSGLPGRVAWRANSRGVALPSGAFVNGDRAAFRRGETTYVLTLMGEGRAGRAGLPWLIDQAGQRAQS